jgi:hypothetical protein
MNPLDMTPEESRRRMIRGRTGMDPGPKLSPEILRAAFEKLDRASRRTEYPPVGVLAVRQGMTDADRDEAIRRFLARLWGGPVLFEVDETTFGGPFEDHPTPRFIDIPGLDEDDECDW